MKFAVIVVVILSLLVVGPSASCALPPAGGTPDGEGAVARAYSDAPELFLISSLDARDELLQVGAGGAEREAAGHDPTLMFLASAAVPGSGQLIQGKARGYIYLAAEVALWGGFYLLESKGMDERDKYEDFADEHWDYNDYTDWYEATCVDCPDCDPYLCRPLAEVGTQEYYEDIGKYDTYWRWWTNDSNEWDIGWDEYSDSDLERRDDYVGMRGDSNLRLRQARYAMMAALLNHVTAAVDAFLTTRGGTPPTDSVADLGLEFGVADSGDGLTYALTMRY